MYQLYRDVVVMTTEPCNEMSAADETNGLLILG